MLAHLLVVKRVYLTANNDRRGRETDARAGYNSVTVKDRIRCRGARMVLNGSLLAVLWPLLLKCTLRQASLTTKVLKVIR